MEIRRGSSGKDEAGSVGIGLPCQASYDLDLWTGLGQDSQITQSGLFIHGPAGIKMEGGGCVGIRNP